MVTEIKYKIMEVVAVVPTLLAITSTVMGMALTNLRCNEIIIN